MTRVLWRKVLSWKVLFCPCICLCSSIISVNLVYLESDHYHIVCCIDGIPIAPSISTTYKKIDFFVSFGEMFPPDLDEEPTQNPEGGSTSVFLKMLELHDAVAVC